MASGKKTGITINVTPEERALIREVCEGDKRRIKEQVITLFATRRAELRAQNAWQ